MNGDLINAIRHKAVIRFRNSGFPCEVEPHSYGLSEDGQEVLLAYELDLGWYVYPVANLWNIYEEDISFDTPRPGYRQMSQAISQVYASV